MEGAKRLIHILPSNRWSGVERYAFDICRHFRGEGWDVNVLTRDAKAVDSQFEREGLELIHAPLRGVIDLQSVFTLAKALRETPDREVVVHIHGFRQAFGALLARRISRHKSTRIVMTRHKVKGGVDSWFFNRIYNHLDAIIFVSALSKEKFLSTWYGRRRPFDEGRLHVVRNSINMEPGDYSDREQLSPLVAMFHGPLKPGKGLETLIDALPMVGEKFRLRIVGSGRPDYVDRLRRRAQARGVMNMIDWHKHVDDPLPFIRDCDLGVLPSQEREAFGLVNIEYMACGRPQVASSNGAQPEYLTDGKEAFLVVPGNPTLLAEAIRTLVRDRDLRRRMGAHALESFRKNLGWRDFARRLSQIYNSE